MLGAGGWGGSQFFEGFVEGAFGADAGGGDALEGFVFGEQRVDAFGDSECGFEAIGALNIPGGEDELGEDGALDGGVGAKFVFVGGCEVANFW